MGYIAKYQIRPGILGYWVCSPAGDNWSSLHPKPFETLEKAEEALRRHATERPIFYDENGEAV